MKILIAEDDAKIARSLARNFQAEGYPTSIANNGKEALEIFAKEDIELILLDWRMPEKSGIEVCREIRDKGHTTPIILLTALTDVSNKVEALDLGGGYGGVREMAAANGLVYTIWEGTLWVTDPDTGTFEGLTDGWGGTTAFCSL